MMTRFLIAYPEFKAVDPAQIGLHMGYAKDEMASEVWRKLYEQGLFALTAHKLFIAGVLKKNGGASGAAVFPIASKSAGKLSLSYDTSSASNGNSHDLILMTTRYGQEYIRLRKLTARHGFAL